jgi:hypothetical protein
MSRQDNGGPFTCGVQTFAGNYHVDPQPPEWCEEEVEGEDDNCPKHDGHDEPDWDNIREERAELEREREADGYYDDERHEL